jgi:tetratricopeptide (TPR) repeat protein
LFENYLLDNTLLADDEIAGFDKVMRDSLNNYLELSLDYAHAGLYNEAITLLQLFYKKNTSSTPLLHYYLGWFYENNGEQAKALAAYSKAAATDRSFCFPNKLEEITILTSAIRLNPTDAAAYYYLGNLWYDKRQYPEAITCWEKSVSIDDTFATAHRNLSLAYFNKNGQKERALESMERAFELDQSDARVFMELDQLYKILGRPVKERLTQLINYHNLVLQRDDLYLEMVTLYNSEGDFGHAKSLIEHRRFHPWEGGEGKVVGQYLLCHLELVKKAISTQKFDEALTLLLEAVTYPENMGEGKLYGAPENDINYLRGLIFERLGKNNDAMVCFQKAAVGDISPVQAIYYNDAQPDKIFYIALAHLKLGKAGKANAIFESFITFAKNHADKPVSIDYFAVSLPDMLVFDMDLDKRNTVFCKYLMGLGYLGLGNFDQAKKLLNEVVATDPNHQGAASYLSMIPFLNEMAYLHGNG